MRTVDYSGRNFVKLMGAGALGVSLSRLGLRVRSNKPKIALQIYTVRKRLEREFEETMRAIAGMGYLGIESSPLPESVTLQQAGRVFRENGLKVVGMHAPLPLNDQRDTVLRMAEAFDADRAIFPGWPETDRYKTLDGLKLMADEYNTIGGFLKSHGLRFGLHNHWWEFELNDGVRPFYYLLDHLDPSIFFEVDTYWAKVGGCDPATVVRDFGKRAPLLHIKDGPGVKGETMASHVPLGTGAMDIPAIARAGGENIEWMIVEFDEYAGDIMEGIRRGHTYLTSSGLAEGRS